MTTCVPSPQWRYKACNTAEGVVAEAAHQAGEVAAVAEDAAADVEVAGLRSADVRLQFASPDNSKPHTHHAMCQF